MSSVVFLRGVNVGGRRAFRPAALARELSALDVVNVGAAGTFVVRQAVRQAALREAIVRLLPFEAEVMICRGRDVADLVTADPFPASRGKDVRRFVSVLSKRPSRSPRLPLDHPAGKAWQVRIVGLRGRFALSLRRSAGRATVYPNEVVEKEFAVSATTRSWNTIERIHDILRA